MSTHPLSFNSLAPLSITHHTSHHSPTTAAYDIRAIALEVAKDTTLEDTLRTPAKELANRLTLVDYSGYPVQPTPYSALSSLLTQPLHETDAVIACQGLTAVVFIEKTRSMHIGNLTILLDTTMDAPSVVRAHTPTILTTPQFPLLC